MLTDLIISYIRQGATLAVGAILGWLTVRFQWLPFDDIDSATVAGWVTAAITALYYVVIRWLAARWPVFGNFFVVNSRPQYAASNEDFEAAA